MNALAILIFISQLTQFKSAAWVMYVMVAVTLVIIYGLPRITKAVPSALVAIIVMTIVSIALGLNVSTVGDMGHIPSTLQALVGVMIMVSISTFDWKSIANMRRIPFSDTFVMMVTVAVVVYTHDLARGVILSAVIFGWRIASRIHVQRTHTEDQVGHYLIHGQLFFGTTTKFMDRFDPKQDPNHIVIDFSQSHVWDHSAVTAIAKVSLKYKQAGKEVRIVGLNKESKLLVERVGLAAPSGH